MYRLCILLNDEPYAKIPMEFVHGDYIKAKDSGAVEAFCKQFDIPESDLCRENRELVALVNRLDSVPIADYLGKVDEEGRFQPIPSGNCKIELISNDGKVLWRTTAISYEKPSKL